LGPKGRNFGPFWFGCLKKVSLTFPNHLWAIFPGASGPWPSLGISPYFSLLLQRVPIFLQVLNFSPEVGEFSLFPGWGFLPNIRWGLDLRFFNLFGEGVTVYRGFRFSPFFGGAEILWGVISVLPECFWGSGTLYFSPVPGFLGPSSLWGETPPAGSKVPQNLGCPPWPTLVVGSGKASWGGLVSGAAGDHYFPPGGLESGGPPLL